jgi:hypothetical protein
MPVTAVMTIASVLLLAIFFEPGMPQNRLPRRPGLPALPWLQRAPAAGLFEHNFGYWSRRASLAHVALVAALAAASVA